MISSGLVIASQGDQRRMQRMSYIEWLNQFIIYGVISGSFDLIINYKIIVD